MKFLLDTDVLIDFFHDQEYANNLISKFIKEDPLYISIITITELRAGFTKEQAAFFLPRLYDLTTVLITNRQIAELAGEFRFEYGRKGKLLSITDAVIASTAILEKCQLVTRNQKDFPMPEIKLYPIGE